MFKLPSLAILLLTNIVLPIALIIFAAGFFPYKTYIPGRAAFDNEAASKARALAPFDKVIFMVVDALRRWLPPHPLLQAIDYSSDFVYSENSGFQFAQRYVR